jgi:hypothetical protein
MSDAASGSFHVQEASAAFQSKSEDAGRLARILRGPLQSNGLCLLSLVMLGQSTLFLARSSNYLSRMDANLASLLDGGGVRGLSSLIILRYIMEMVNAGRKASDKVRPYEVFDMIGGTSTGG